MNLLFALVIGCITHLNAPQAEDHKAIWNYEFSVLVNVPGKKQVQTAIRMWVCSSPRFYLEETLPGDMKRMCYYDGNILYTCMGNDQMKTHFAKHDVSRLPAVIDRHFVAFYYSTKVIPCISLEGAANGVYKHCKNVGVSFQDAYEVQNEADVIKYKSKHITFTFAKSTAMVKFIKFLKDGKQVDVINEIERDMLGMNSDYITRLGRVAFGEDLKLFQDETKALIEFAQSLSK